MSTTTKVKDYSHPRYNIVREHFKYPTEIHYEAFDARRAEREAESQETPKDDGAVSS